MKRWILSSLIIITTLSCSVKTFGQVKHFESLDMSNGLSSSTVYSIVQDDYGFIWIGTKNGLNIYNGIDFRSFYAEPDNEFSLPGNQIEKILMNGDTAYIGTQSGLCMMDVISKECIQIDIGTNFRIRTLYLEKKNGILWIGTQKGLIKYSISSNEYKLFNTTNCNISHDIIRSIYKDEDGTLWVGTFDKLNSLASESTVFEQISFVKKTSSNIENNLILSINPYNNNSDSLLMIGTQTGLVIYNRFEQKVEMIIDESSGLTNSVIKDIHLTESGILWLGTDFGLVEMFNEKVQDIHVHDPYKRNSLTNSRVWTIYEDEAGTLWFGTDNGVSTLSNSMERFSFYPMVFDIKGVRSGYEVRSIIEDQNRQLWMATQNGFIRYNKDNKTLQSFNSDIPLLSDAISVFEDSKGRIWVATNGGITLYNPLTKVLRNYSAKVGQGSGLRTNYIDGFIESSTGEILVNTFDGLHKVSESDDKISFDFIGKLRIDGVGNNALWSFIDNSLFRVDPETFESQELLNDPFKDQNNRFLTLLFDSLKNKLWLGYNNGLVLYDIDSQDHMIFNIQSNKEYPLLSLLQDDDGNIWASSYSAIIRFSPINDEYEIFPSGEGVSISRFFENSSFKCKDSDLVFGGQDGFIRFLPKNISKSGYDPEIRFTKLIVANNEILNTEISFTQELVLDYLNGSFAVEFSSLHYGRRGGIRYRYLLEGEDQNWNYIDNPAGRATYSRLIAGDYLLRVQGTNNDGVWSNDEATLKIKINPPVWASIYFILVYILILLLIIGTLIYYYHNRTRWKNQMKIIRLEKEHAESEAKNRQHFFTNVAHEFRTPLNLIIGPLEKLLNSQSLDESSMRSAHIMENNARRLLWLNNQFLDLRKVENKTMQLTISEFDINEFLDSIYVLFKDQAESQKIKYNFQKIDEKINIKSDFHKLETIVYNLLSNAFKYTDNGGEIILKLYAESNNIFISVKDTGIGIPDKDQQKIFDRFYQTKESQKLKRGLGIGLNLVKEYVEMLKGEITLESQPGLGSEFRVRLPEQGEFDIDQSKKEFASIKPVLTSRTKEIPGDVAISNPKNAPRILLVEDESELADFILGSLRQNYRIEKVTNGLEALKLMSKLKPNIVISDIHMPEMDGIELIKKLKGNPKTAHIPIIIISGASEKESQVAALKEGADAYIIKPFGIELLELRIENFLKRDDHLSEIFKLSKLSKPKEIEVSSQNDKIIKKVVASIEKYISDPDLNVDKVCDDTGFSHTFLYRKIKKLTGQTLKEFIRTVRLQRAAQLIKTKKLTISEVMAETGFSNHSYFSKCFKKIYNVAPKEYMDE